MTYTSLEVLMDNLKLLISHNNDNPLINNNPQIITKRPQIEQLYQEPSFMIQIMFMENHNNLHDTTHLKNVKKRFKAVAQEAHSIVGFFVYANFYMNRIGREINYKKYRNLENVMRDLKSIRKEFVTIHGRRKMDSSPSIEAFKTLTVIESYGPRNPIRMRKVSEERFVGLDHGARQIIDKLVEDQKQLDVVSIVGMGGIGKTTLATKVYNDRYIVHHFNLRAWVTISQTYERQDLLIQILQSLCIEFDPANYSELREKLHKTLMGRRYLIVVDDIWSTKAWDDLKLFFPNYHIGSRILLTSRLREVALIAKSHGLIYQLECLTNAKSWELLCKKVFHDNDCPESLIEPGMKIARYCHGLPLAIVVIAGVLGKIEAQKVSWERIAQSVGSYIVSEKNVYMDILGLSYEHLPTHLKDCFLYLGGFPEDYEFQVEKLIWHWIGEGFVQEDGNRSLEAIGEAYLMELVDRNLVAVLDRKFNGAIATCSLHDLIRELCWERATDENFFLKINAPVISYHFVRKQKPRRIFTNMNFLTNNAPDHPSLFLGEVQSLLCFAADDFSSSKITEGYFLYYPLLRVLDLGALAAFPPEIGLLVHLRYLAFSITEEGFPVSICYLWSLHTLILRCKEDVFLPEAISNLVNLKHLWCDEFLHIPLIEKPMNLQTISTVILEDVALSWEKYFPSIKQVACMTHTHHDFESLDSLTKLAWISVDTSTIDQPTSFPVTFPTSLQNLSLSRCRLPWSDMSIIESLPNLEFLQLLENAFMGDTWETGEAQFQQLKVLKLVDLDIQLWEVSSINFPCLEQLVVCKCKNLEEIPLEIGNISTLMLLQVDDSNSRVVESLDSIQEEQQNSGNFDMKINVKNEYVHEGIEQFVNFNSNDHSDHL